jgi:pimeloyl-ACP methyl ester carboxylesterase
VPARRFKVDSVEIALHEHGQGEPVMLVHGLASRASDLLALVAPVSGFGFVAPDLPGFGDSAKPRRFLHSPDGYGAFLCRLARALGLARYALVGVGTGRLIAARAARRDQARVVGAAALPEPWSLQALLARTLAPAQARATLELATTYRQGERRDGLERCRDAAALSLWLARAFAARPAGAAEEATDEAAERARAEELMRRDQERRRLRVLS